MHERVRGRRVQVRGRRVRTRVLLREFVDRRGGAGANRYERVRRGLHGSAGIDVWRFVGYSTLFRRITSIRPFAITLEGEIIEPFLLQYDFI